MSSNPFLGTLVAVEVNRWRKPGASDLARHNLICYGNKCLSFRTDEEIHR